MKIDFLLRLPIRFYRYFISPLLGPRCRYIPSCSCYTEDAIEKHGALKGLFLGLKRFCRCHPWSKHPLSDPVPERFAWRDMMVYKGCVQKHKEGHNHE